MQNDSITLKVLAIAIIGGACLIASFAVMGLVSERQDRGLEASNEIALIWGGRQTLSGPMLVKKSIVAGATQNEFVLPHSLKYETKLLPEVRSRGIFKTVVYKSTNVVTGEFNASDIKAVFDNDSNALLTVAISDTRGIERQMSINWNGTSLPLEPGAGVNLYGMSGLHSTVPLTRTTKTVPFSFEVELKGSEGFSFIPLGRETKIALESAWPSPKFVGAFLPSSQTVNKDGFKAGWQVSSFGRSYPQSFKTTEVYFDQVLLSAAGVDLLQVIDIYDMTLRSVKYAILFILITFAAFFLFDVLGGVRVHPIQYLLIGAALALFYLLLLSFSEWLGFPTAYLLATIMTACLVGSYSSFVLKSGNRAFLISIILVLLYGYLYLILQLEDYALVAGSLLMFILLGGAMYATRNIDWFSLERKGH
ncbi:MAG: cell envelope integrity protein CreD [Candidatus Vogelbacteria bacterium]|nr:cell envelope integrity protein CreD [Candidatus Vogelbacteria bacterium]